MEAHSKPPPQLTHPPFSFQSQQIASNLFPKSKGILPPTILAVVEFEKLPELISLKRHIKSRLNNYRFSSVPTPTKNPSVWEWQQCEGFDAGENFILASIRSANNSSSTGKKSTPTLIEYLESIAFREWNMQKPLWKIHILENQDAASPVHLEMNDEGVNVQPISRDCRCVIILETHHSIGDGISMIQLAHSMFSDADGKQFQWENTKHKRPRLSFLRKLGFIAAMPIHFFKSQSMFMLSDSNHKFKVRYLEEIKNKKNLTK